MFLTGRAHSYSLWHWRTISSLLILYKITANPDKLFSSFHHRCHATNTRVLQLAHSQTLINFCGRNDQLFKSFFLSTLRLRNSLHPCVFEGVHSVIHFMLRSNSISLTYSKPDILRPTMFAFRSQNFEINHQDKPPKGVGGGRN